MQFPEAVENAIREFTKLPSVGRKSAQRLVQYLLKSPDYRIEKFADVLMALKRDIHFCKICFHITEIQNELCSFCSDPTRDQKIVCVVEEFIDVFAIENTGEYRGVYHVLQGALSPIDGIGPDKLTINALLQRLSKGETEEMIFATNPTMEGEATAMYIKKHLPSDSVFALTRIAKGMPVGGDIDYADQMTLGSSMKQRVVF